MNNDSEPLRVDTTPDPDLKVDTDGDFKVPTYDIAPQDRHIADAILAMDPLRDVPSPFRGFEGVRQPELTLATLPPNCAKVSKDSWPIPRPASGPRLSGPSSAPPWSRTADGFGSRRGLAKALSPFTKRRLSFQHSTAPYLNALIASATSWPRSLALM